MSSVKRVLVTGANKGVGLAIVERLLSERADTYILLGARSKQRAKDAAATLCARVPAWASRLEVLELDVSDATSVAAAASEVASRFGATDALFGLVNNAGIAAGTPAELLAVNLYGVKACTDAFTPLLCRGGRVVQVSSGSAPMFVAKCSPERQHFFTRPGVSWAELETVVAEFLAAADGGDAALLQAGFPAPTERESLAYVAYGFSKAALNVYTRLASTQLPALLVNACTPGFIITDLTRHMFGGGRPEEFGALPPSQSTVATWRLLFEGDVGSGHYFGSDGLRSPMGSYRSPGSAEYAGEE